ncbi:GNAT family N-acetyltransferase [Alicyclobacillus dauci]|uniref:GNAT family N-acetyltransferase n=2 Tax=Alicyclobacillus dauci TaxID=1475485 RepID=A0ABY6Z878_9BACL|nr:GNAT family N-acetyltransferase [Alicyclobacillus dauci]
MAMPIKYLLGNKIYLRSLEQTDVEFMHQFVNNDVEARRLTGTQNCFTLAQIEAYIGSQGHDDSRVVFGIVRHEDDQMVGEVVLNDIDRNNRSANFRIAISDPFTGQGYGTEATRLMLDYGFGMLNLHRIELDVYTINERAAHVYEKVGFKREGVKRQNWYFNHQYYDSIVMSVLENEFRAMKTTK